mmetsp:Transcript_44421/g.82945  ORF Transcript_44421/g.82945 Transcript_44421/m.82945 type:complete len:293 (+) Transcript_44421:1355-2233(+)
MQHLCVELLRANIWARGAQHVAADITTRGQSIHAGLVHGSHGGLHISLEDPVHLPGLPCGDLQGAVCEISANVIHGNPLLCRAEPTRKAHTNHKAECVLHSHLLTLLSKITVVLLIAAMRLDQLRVLERNLAGRNIIQTFLHAAPQLPGLYLNLLVRLDGTIITAASSICLVHTETREQLALPLGKARVVLVSILVVAEAGRHHALGSHFFQEVVQVARGLCEVELGLLCALAPVVGIAQAEDAVLQVIEREVRALGKLGEQVAAISAKLAFPGGCHTEDHKRLRSQSGDIE